MIAMALWKWACLGVWVALLAFVLCIGVAHAYNKRHRP